MEMTCGSENGGEPRQDLKAAAAPLLTVTRNGRHDLQHMGFACLVDAEGNRIWSRGDPHAHAYFRSSAKPLQALALLASGAADAAGLDARDLAVICGSHAGGSEQTVLVRALLAKSGLKPDQLGCGELPGEDAGTGGKGDAGGEAALADMCSGKHAGMLTACKHLKLPLESYLEPEHPWQKRILATVCEYCAMDAENMHQAVDGCSAPTFSLPVYNMALGFARLAREAARSGPASRLLSAMAGNPSLTGEPDLRAYPLEGVPMTAVGAAMVAKKGANGLHCAALPGLGLGFAMKVIDGSQLPCWPVFTRVLERTGILSTATAAAMRAALWPRIRTRKGADAGEILVDF